MDIHIANREAADRIVQGFLAVGELGTGVGAFEGLPAAAVWPNKEDFALRLSSEVHQGWMWGVIVYG